MKFIIQHQEAIITAIAVLASKIIHSEIAKMYLRQKGILRDKAYWKYRYNTISGNPSKNNKKKYRKRS